MIRFTHDSRQQERQPARDAPLVPFGRSDPGNPHDVPHPPEAVPRLPLSVGELPQPDNVGKATVAMLPGLVIPADNPAITLPSIISIDVAPCERKTRSGFESPSKE